ncbi:hypothetical protein D9M72_229200 [compost metagenome]
MERHGLHPLRLQLTGDEVDNPRVLGKQDGLLPFGGNCHQPFNHGALLAGELRQPADTVYPVLRVVGGEMHRTDPGKNGNQIVRPAILADVPVPFGKLVRRTQVERQVSRIPVRLDHLHSWWLDLDVPRHVGLADQATLHVRRQHLAIPREIANLRHFALRPVLQALRKFPGHPLQHHKITAEAVDTSFGMLRRGQPVRLEVAAPVAVRLGRSAVATRERDQSEDVTRIVGDRAACQDIAASGRQLP